MEKTNVTKRVTATILSMSLLTVMAGAAIAPALGIIKAHFSEADALLVQLIVSMPALLIIVTNLFFLSISPLFGAVCLAPCGHAAVAQPVWSRPHCSLQGSHSALFRLPRSGLDNSPFSKSAAEAITMYYWIILSMFKRV